MTAQRSITALTIQRCASNYNVILLQDFCYHDAPDTFNIIDAINTCVTVVAYACDSSRANQMLVSNIFKISVSEECSLVATFVHSCSPLHLVSPLSTSRPIARSYQGQIINCQLSVYCQCYRDLNVMVRSHCPIPRQAQDRHRC